MLSANAGVCAEPSNPKLQENKMKKKRQPLERGERKDGVHCTWKTNYVFCDLLTGLFCKD